MLSYQLLLILAFFVRRSLAYKVAVLGASGGIGQPLSLLLKMEPLVTELSLFDVVNSIGVASDLSHCCTGAKVSGHMGMDELESSLKGLYALCVQDQTHFCIKFE